MRTEGGKNKSGAAEGEGEPGSEGPVCPGVELVQQGQTHHSCSRPRGMYLPWLTPQGSLIVILKDSTKSTWQFTRTDGAGLGVADTLTHTHGRAHNAVRPHAHADTHAHRQHAYTSPASPYPAPPLAGTCSMDPGHAATWHTEAHTWPESRHRSSPAYRRHLHQLPAHSCLARSEGRLQCSGE